MATLLQTAEVVPLHFGNANQPLSDIELLHSISIELIGEKDLKALYNKIVDAAVAITKSQFGTMQLVRPADDASGHAGELELLCARGFQPGTVDAWQWVSPEALTSCAKALKQRRRVIIADYEKWDEIVGTEELANFLRADIRSAQTTPLISRGGELLGMISTHWSEPHTPSDRDLHLLDIVARQAADLLERTIADEALRAAEAKLRILNETLETRVQRRESDLLAAQGQVRQMQKLEAMGQLTGGVAHDFNNLLTVIRSSAELLRRHASLPEEKRARYLDAITETSDRAAKLTAQLLAFARRQALKPVTFDVGGQIAKIADMMNTVVGSRIKLTVDTAPYPCFVEADISQFETALVNMAVNARDATIGKGDVTIRVREASAIPALRGHVGHEGSFVSVSVIDTGVGMSPEIIERIFEPFFTTKGVGKGTGLGLAQVFGFAKQSGGDVDVESREGKGSTFTIYLPRVEAAARASGDETQEPLPDEFGTILIVEDNATVGEFAQRLLDDLGYKTCLVENGQRAIAVLKERGSEFDFVFSDVVMPGISGLELGRRIKARWPTLPVVLTSGYSQALAEEKHHGFPILQKPYSVGELSRVLRASRRQI